MRLPRELSLALVTLVLSAGLLCGGVCAQTQVDAALIEPSISVAVIVHPSVTSDTLTRNELLDYYTGELQEWPDGTRVVIKDLKAKGPVRAAFYEFLGQRPSRLKSIWLRNLLAGEGERPESLGDEQKMLEVVAATPGSIGFISAEWVDPRVRTIILIDEGR
ncbi:MAG: hypothetical protein HOM68_06700 [Gemmatimonadetes bacterium]|jgi:ABC-type phosphate transport system substrate-binding protein|nr:hypothetical protein [Gemmatimonadota bacterium]MBT4610041.1 hypothetical protein [Gemmatimonadota bacterium]MBT5056210.1 hypothetical protein [Gemmatimonadota bacterium]MBT5146335.1 hypothetical protein [Gemmatimonadota bacterium]MBT5591258.1 hypothetical protein [Gemmatimonadota bacterium]